MWGVNLIGLQVIYDFLKGGTKFYYEFLSSSVKIGIYLLF